MRIDMVYVDDWEVMYVDFHKVTEGHYISSQAVLNVVCARKEAVDDVDFHYPGDDIVDHLDFNFPEHFGDIPL